jgi:Family of unknown function (DUF5947)
MKTAALERTIRRGWPQPAERCDLCGTDVVDQHPHLLDTTRQVPVCTCPACHLLFERPTASPGRFLAIPDRRMPVEGVVPADLGIPVGLAFFTLRAAGEVEARYPSPLGTTRWDVPPAAWAATIQRAPVLAGLAPEVEALLVNTTASRRSAWIVPVTDCYRLVGLVRQHWEGLSGGDRVRAETAHFFDELEKGGNSDGTHTRR